MVVNLFLFSLDMFTDSILPSTLIYNLGLIVIMQGSDFSLFKVSLQERSTV